MSSNGTSGACPSPASERIDWVDYAKGICIVMVVMMHSTLGVEAAAGKQGFMHLFVEFAKPFRMPDFFLISGLFLARVIGRDWRTYLDRKVVHFAYFYVLWVTIQFAFKAPAFAAEQGWTHVGVMYLQSFIEPFGTLWFIYLLPVFFVVTKATLRVPAIVIWLAAAALETAHGAKGRVEPVPTDGDYSIFIDYAVTPDAIENVLTTLRGIAPKRLVMLFGAGGDRDRKKRPIMGKLSADIADFVIVTSDNPRTEDPMSIIEEILPGVRAGKAPYKVICDRPEAIRWAIDHHEPGDVILLCGKGHEDYQIIGHEKIHMDEREIVADYLAERAKRT